MYRSAVSCEGNRYLRDYLREMNHLPQFFFNDLHNFENEKYARSAISVLKNKGIHFYIVLKP